jgi:hypothetical protein
MQRVANQASDAGQATKISRRPAELGSDGSDPKRAKGNRVVRYGLGLGVAVKGLGVSVGTGVTIFT